MSNPEEELIQKYQAELDAARIATAQESLVRRQQETFMQNDDKSIVKEQLDLTEEITRIDYLLKGYSLEPSDSGQLMWVKPENDDLVIFSPYGIHLIRNTICWYLNKNLLLSNFDEATIRKKMWDFTNDLIDTIYMEYDKVFLYPTPAQCEKVLRDRIEKQADSIVFSMKLRGKEESREEVIKMKMLEIAPHSEKEIEKIRTQLINQKLKRYVMTIRVIQDAIHATFMRAWKGLERDTMRKYTHVSETRGGAVSMPQQNSGGIWPWQKK